MNETLVSLSYLEFLTNIESKFKMATEILTQEFLHTVFEYKNGNLYRKISAGRSKKGDIAGSKHPNGYCKIAIKNKTYLIHRVIFLMVKGYCPEFIDHINNNRSDNRIENLRSCSREENHKNQKIPKTNSSGIKNVYWDKRTNKWCVALRINKNQKKYIGLYESKDLAKISAINARNKYHGKFANHE